MRFLLLRLVLVVSYFATVAYILYFIFNNPGFVVEDNIFFFLSANLILAPLTVFYFFYSLTFMLFMVNLLCDVSLLIYDFTKGIKDQKTIEVIKKSTIFIIIFSLYPFIVSYEYIINRKINPKVSDIFMNIFTDTIPDIHEG